jgi:hypothetical protein
MEREKSNDKQQRGRILGTYGVLPSGSGVADSPAEPGVADVDGLHHLGAVQVSGGETGINAGHGAVSDDAGQAALREIHATVSQC